eukprot:2737760-Pleurochrysis_carterae.AAC.2
MSPREIRYLRAHSATVEVFRRFNLPIYLQLRVQASMRASYHREHKRRCIGRRLSPPSYRVRWHSPTPSHSDALLRLRTYIHGQRNALPASCTRVPAGRQTQAEAQALAQTGAHA